MTDGVIERLAELETAVRRASDALVRLRDDNARLKREVTRLMDERKQILGQIDGILKDIGKLELEG